MARYGMLPTGYARIGPASMTVIRLWLSVTPGAVAGGGTNDKTVNALTIIRNNLPQEPLVEYGGGTYYRGMTTHYALQELI